MLLIYNDIIFSIKCAKSLRSKEKIVKKGLHCSFFLSIVHLSGRKWVFVENCALGGDIGRSYLSAVLVATKGWSPMLNKQFFTILVLRFILDLGK